MRAGGQILGRLQLHVLFDLDGTLTDSRAGIARCIQHALVELGVVCPPEQRLTEFVGPALATAFGSLLDTDEPARIDEAIAAFRERFERIGMFENALYPGIDEAVGDLVDMGFSLCVVTAKPRVYAARILEHFHLREHFAGVYGPDLADRKYSKELLIRQACLAEGVAPAHAVMVGDRVEDILGAQANHLQTAAVLWGYGDPAELEAAAPDYLAPTAADLVVWLRDVRTLAVS
jgi:phosphoglycolate phosphatase